MSTTTTYTGVRIVDMPDLGAFTSGSSIVGEKSGSGRFSAASLSGYFLPLSQLGTSPGQVPIFENYHGSGNPGLEFPSTLFIQKAGATTSTDFATINVARVTSHTTGTNNVIANVYAGVQVNSDSPNQECAVLGQVSTISNTPAASAIGVWGQAYRTGTSVSNLWGLLGNTSDETGASTSASGGAISTGEFGMRANNFDDRVNLPKFGGQGGRQLIQIGLARWNRASTDFVEASSGIWFVSGQQTDDPTKNTYLQGIGLAVATQMYQFLDARGGAVPAGYTDPFCAVRMSAGQIIDFNGGTTLKSGAGNYLQYVAGGALRLQYVVGGTPLWAVTNSGLMILGVLPPNAANDAAAAAAFVPVGGFYRNGSVVMIRTV